MNTVKFYQDEFKRMQEADRNFLGFPARLGNSAGIIDAGNGDVYVMMMLDGQTLTIPNRRVSLDLGKPVLIGTTRDDPNTLQVLGDWAVYSKPWPNGREPHSRQHGYSSYDTDWIEPERFQWLLCLPELSLGNFYIRAFGGTIDWQGGIITIDNQTLDLSASVPTTGALYTLIQCDNTGVITSKDGTPVAGKEFLTNADIPAPDADNFSLCAIRLYEAQEKLQRDIRAGKVNDFVDLRFTVNGASTGGGGGTWGSITGTLSDQTDLQAALDAKLDMYTFFNVY